MNITVALSDIQSQGGAKLFFDQLISFLPQHKWVLTQKKIPRDTDILIYGNKHEFYEKAKTLKIPIIIQRTQGRRALSLPQPDDLHAVICSSSASYARSGHPRKHLIYNGIDKALADSLKPIHCDLLCAESRIGKGQRIDKSCIWATKHKRQLTILGSKQNSSENIEEQLKIKYKSFDWVGLVGYEKSLQYIKGCSSLIVGSSAHGLSNSVCAAIYFGKPIVNLGGVETIEEVPDIRETAKKYENLFKN